GSISAQLMGLAKTGAKLDLTPEMQPFGNVSVGQMSNDVPFTVTNNGDEASTVPTIVSSSAQFVGPGNPCQNNTLDPNEACTFQVRFVPSAVGEAMGNLTVTATGTM